MIKAEKKSNNVEEGSVQDTSSEVLATKDEQPAAKKKTLMEYLRSERMKTIDKYLGWLSGS